jgi:hypothetical protein
VATQDYVDVPAPYVEELRAICLGLPDAYEEQAWTGRRWMVRRRNFAHVFCIDSPRGADTILIFLSSGPELEVLGRMGHPFFRGRWGNNVVGMVLDDRTDWDEVAELMTESYCVMAPKKLVALVDRPNPDGDGDSPDDGERKRPNDKRDEAG